ncbi:MAG: HdeD family acid-resistance protein [Nakamurella sp.]
MRTSTIVSAVAGIVLGLIMLFWPAITLLSLASLFGIALIMAGLYRIVFGVTVVRVRPGLRWLMGILGVLMVIAGVLCLARPVATLLFVAIMIGVAWIFEGIHDVIAGIAGITVGPRWLALVGGVIGVIAGIVVLSTPGLALSTFAVVGGILLIVVSIVALCTLPRKTAAG